jgi:hypothetical protein
MLHRRGVAVHARGALITVFVGPKNRFQKAVLFYCLSAYGSVKSCIPFQKFRVCL